jgi:diacylglycerol kinase (ATP)
MTSQPNSDRAGQSVTPLFDRTVVLANSQSSRGRASNLLPSVARMFASHGVIAEIRNTTSLIDLETQTHDAIMGGAKLLFAAGGDGTLQCLVNAAFGHDVILGVIPAGGGNDFARALALPQNPLEALRMALEGEPRTVDLARARLSEGRQRLFLGGGGVGLDADTAKLSGGRFRNWPGRWRYLASAVCAYTMHKPRRVHVTIDSPAGNTPWQESILACVLNTPTFGAGIRLAPRARIDDGLLDFAFLDELSIGRLLCVLPQLALRGTLQLPRLRATQFCKLRLETETPAGFHGDGELLGFTPVEIEVVPGAVQFLAPKPARS